MQDGALMALLLGRLWACSWSAASQACVLRLTHSLHSQSAFTHAERLLLQHGSSHSLQELLVLATQVLGRSGTEQCSPQLSNTYLDEAWAGKASQLQAGPTTKQHAFWDVMCRSMEASAFKQVSAVPKEF